VTGVAGGPARDRRRVTDAVSVRNDDAAIGAAGSHPPFKRVLIANRGEIALRILRACRELGMEAVAVYSDADAEAPWVREADIAVRLGPPPPSESYLREDLVIRAALEAGAEAVHPGYGFLSERAQFARAVEAAGLRFVGPPADAIAALGDKIAARRRALAAGVPIVPGSEDVVPTADPAAVARTVAMAVEIGFPLLVKAAAGGGGRGMRRVGEPRELPAALVAGSAEAASSFGDGRVYLEREVRPARHVEVQLLGDAQGELVAIGERDCSIQRRHQKLVEEAPAPGLGPEDRRQLHALAVLAGRASGLENAATAEFLRDAAGRFWFLEVNARLQVEHGVTELVTGVDIVREQFLLAAGMPLSEGARSAAREAIDVGRHAIEVRLSAEDPATDFTPAPGRVGRWRMPSGPGVRVDTAIEPGVRVPPDYDPLVAKVLVQAEDRPAAIRRLQRALDEVEITGIQTTLPFHRALVGDATFLAGDVSTDWVADRWHGNAERARALEKAALYAARLLATGEPSRPASVREVSLRKDAPGAWRETGREAAVDRWPR
jgi:acetyl-CoA carboxylase biotin carboxylase subunit